MASEQKTILIVEDEPDTAEMFAEMMRLSGYRVVKAFNGANVVELVQSESPSALVLDMMMPDVSGLDVLVILRKMSEYKNLPIVVVSAKSLPSDIKVGLDAGATFYLTKPVSFMELRKTIQRAIDQVGV